MQCNKCETDKHESEFYAKDKTCKCCRREMVRANRAAKVDYYREFDRNRDTPERAKKRKEYIRTDAGKAAKKRANQAYQERYPMRRAAHVIVGNAVRDGKLIKPHAYESCGFTGSIEAHHDDYTKPLDVRWLCDPCHKQWHRENEPIYV